MKKSFLLFLLVVVFSLDNFAQTAENLLAANQTGVAEIYLARDDGAGAPAAPVESFLTTDVPIHCVVALDSTAAATIKMSFVAAAVKGVKPETKVVAVSYQTDGRQNRVNFTGKPDGAWIAGVYRVDIFINGKFAQSKTFAIVKAAAAAAAAAPTNSFQPRSAPKPKPARRPRKN